MRVYDHFETCCEIPRMQVTLQAGRDDTHVVVVDENNERLFETLVYDVTLKGDITPEAVLSGAHDQAAAAARRLLEEAEEAAQRYLLASAAADTLYEAWVAAHQGEGPEIKSRF